MCPSKLVCITGFLSFSTIRQPAFGGLRHVRRPLIGIWRGGDRVLGDGGRPLH